MIILEAPKNPIQGTLHLCGSKSISNRLVMLKAILGSDLRLQNISNSHDTTTLQLAIRQILQKQGTTIDVNHAGSDMRFLTAFLSVYPGEFTLTGSERLQQRPIADLVQALRSLGADIHYTQKEHFPPLLIKGKALPGGRVEINGHISSQFISALLLIAPGLKKGISIHVKGELVSKPYVEMTLSLLKEFGFHVEWTQNTIEVTPNSSGSYPNTYPVESDWSSASYFYSICALSSNASIQLSNFKRQSLQADSILADVFSQLGVHTTFLSESIHLRSIPLNIKEFNYNCRNCPDIAQTLAVCCFGLGIPCKLSGLSTLKIKETDRLFALKTELEKLGAHVHIDSESIQVFAKTNGMHIKADNTTPTITTYKDHRMAMSFAPLALTRGRLLIDDPHVVDKSYPSFWQDLKSLGFNVNLQP